MQSNDFLTPGLAPPWKVVSSSLNTEPEPGVLTIEIAADRGSLYPCPICGSECKAHDYKEQEWQHLDFFPAPLLHYRASSRGQVQGAWSPSGSRSLGAARKRFHASF